MTLSDAFRAQIDRLTDLEPRVDGLLDALLDTEPVTSVRFNRCKCPVVPQRVSTVPLGDRVPWCERGFYLDSRPRFTLDPAIHQGLYYVQDASSMFLAHVLRSLTACSHRPLVYLDACAAPGGKTTTAIDSLPDGSLVVANEWDYRRAEILRENISKWGYPAAIVSRGDTRQYRSMRDMFDIIAADVPCSGEGMMRKDSVAVEQWTPALVGQCVERQREIVDNLWSALKPGGYFIYSTCTFNRRENEEMVEYLAEEYDALSVEIDTGLFQGIVGAIDAPYHCYRFMPHLVRGEGLFMAVMQKSGEQIIAKKENRKDTRPSKLTIKLPSWFPTALSPLPMGDTLWGVDPSWRAVVDRLVKSVDVIMPGVEIATIKGKDMIPAQALAMSQALDEDAFQQVEVDIDTAISYLCRDAVTLDPSVPRGYILLTHNGHPLGFVKNLGNRANNLYPTPWRILHRATN